MTKEELKRKLSSVISSLECAREDADEDMDGALTHAEIALCALRDLVSRKREILAA